MISLALAAFIQLAGTGLIGPVNLFSPNGEDPRQAQVQVGVGRPYAPIGQLLTKDEIAKMQDGALVRGHSSGTATLIAPCYALTTAHEVFGDGTSDFVELIFRSVAPDGKGVVDTPAWPVAWGPTRKFGDDWALVRLVRCEGRRLGWIKLSPLSLGDLARAPAETAGFPADREANRLWRQPHCAIKSFELALGLLSTDCAARKGASGSPILTRTKSGELELVGMIVQETNPRLEVLRQYDKRFANLAVYVRGIWPSIQPWLAEDGR